MAEWCGECGMEIWAYCLMPNHVHLIAIASDAGGLRRAIGKAHRYPYSSARAHVEGRADPLLDDSPLTKMIDDWASFLSAGMDPQEQERLYRHERTGRPLGSERFIKKLEKALRRVLRPQKGGRPRKKKNQ
jgi:putative transposase